MLKQTLLARMAGSCGVTAACATLLHENCGTPDNVAITTLVRTNVRTCTPPNHGWYEITDCESTSMFYYNGKLVAEIAYANRGFWAFVAHTYCCLTGRIVETWRCKGDNATHDKWQLVTTY